MLILIGDTFGDGDIAVTTDEGITTIGTTSTASSSLTSITLENTGFLGDRVENIAAVTLQTMFTNVAHATGNGDEAVGV